MRRTRVIPVLLLHNGGVVKTIKFKDPVYIGDPINTIRLFNDLEVDEIIVIDIDASRNKRLPDYEVIEELTSEAFMPFAYGGGINDVESAARIFRCGVEKAIFNHSAMHNPSLLTECKDKFGSQSIIASIDYKKKILSGNKYYDYISGAINNLNVIDAVNNAIRAGAGEIFLTSVDKDGVMQGYDLDTIKLISSAIEVPLIVSGGCGDIEHMQQAELAGANAVAAGSMFVFHGKQKGVLINYPDETTLRKYLS